MNISLRRGCLRVVTSVLVTRHSYLNVPYIIRFLQKTEIISLNVINPVDVLYEVGSERIQIY